MARGVLIVEQGERLGAGSLRHYGISSNSLGGAFLEGLDKLPPGGPLDAAQSNWATGELRKNRNAHVPLKTAGMYLDAVGAAIRTEVARHPNCTVACQTSVRQITLNDDGSLAIEIEGAEAAKTVVHAERAVIAMGGEPPDHLERTEILPGLTLNPYGGKLRHASALFDDRKTLPDELLSRLRASGRAAIIGGSHSAWSTAWVLLNDPRFQLHGGLPPRVTLLHRDPIRLFYLTQEAAEKDGYEYDPVADVCPQSGRVNRVGGLKGDARELARQVIRFPNESPVHRVHLNNGIEPRLIRDYLSAADLIVVATGYRARLPELVYESGDPIRVRLSPAGLAVTGNLELIADNGTVFSNLIAYGLGVHIPVSQHVGGEPGYRGAITSVWLYQHNVGEIALQSLLGPDRRRLYQDLAGSPVGAFGGGE